MRCYSRFNVRSKQRQTSGKRPSKSICVCPCTLYTALLPTVTISDVHYVVLADVRVCYPRLYVFSIGTSELRHIPLKYCNCLKLSASISSPSDFETLLHSTFWWIVASKSDAADTLAPDNKLQTLTSNRGLKCKVGGNENINQVSLKVEIES